MERFAEAGMVIEVRANHMPDGGIVTTFTDITASVEAAEALERSNETLERRVRERTEELTLLNVALARAKGEADAANISKTKFLAAASHDILQPLNAARLYVTSLIERGGRDDRRLVDNIDASLEAVEEIFGALLDMSRLDTGAMRPEFSPVPHRRHHAPDRTGIRAARRRQGHRTQIRAVPAGGAFRPAAAAPAGAEPGVERDQIYADRARADRLPPQRRRTCASTSTTPASAFRNRSGAIFSSSFTGSNRARASRAGWASACRSSSAWRACSAARSMSIRPAGGGSHFAVTVARSNAVPVELPARDNARIDPSQLAGTTVICIDNEPVGARRHGNAAARLGLRGHQGARSRHRAWRRLPKAPTPPNGLLVDYHLDHGNGIEAIIALRKRCGNAAGDPDHRRPHAGGARTGARRGHSIAEQADQAGGLARAAGAMARDAGGGGGVVKRASPFRGSRLATNGRFRSWRRRSRPACGFRRRAFAGSPRHAPSRSLPRRVS